MSIPSRDGGAGVSGSSAEPRPTVAFGPFRLDPGERLLRRGDQAVALTPKAFDLLVHLVERPGKLVEKQALMAALWPDAVVEEANLAYTVSTLRKALGDGQEGEQFIQTVPTRGYRFVAPVTDTRSDDSASSAQRRGRAIAIAGAAVFVAALALWWWMESHRAPRPVVRFELTRIPVTDLVTPIISPDGTRVVYAVGAGPQRQLYLRPLDSLDATALPGTLGGDDPTFSPDGRAIAFFVAPGPTTKGRLMTLELATGRLSTVWGLGGPGEGPLGSTWGPDGRIYFGSGYFGIRAVPVTGGIPAIVTAPRPGEGFLGAPEVLPGGRHLMFMAWRSDDVEHANVDVLSLETGERQRILEGAVAPHYLATGHLTYIQRGALFAVRFDPKTLRTSGSPVQVLGDVAAVGGTQSLYSAADNGTLVYHPGGVLTAQTELSWVSGDSEEHIEAPPGFYTDASLSPDDRWLAVAPNYGGRQQVWVHDFVRGTWTCPSTQGIGVAPIWHPLHPTRLVFTTSRSGQPGLDLFSVPADGSDSPELLYASAYPKYAVASSSAGRLIAFMEMHPETQSDLWLLDLADQKPVARPFVRTPAWEGGAAFSPDGRWIVYSTNETGRPEIYVRPVSGPGRWQVSTDGGGIPRWSRDGREIVYRNPKGMWIVDVVSGASFSADRPRRLVEGPFGRGGAVPNYDITADARRILLIRPAKQQRSVPLIVVQNWFAELGKTIGE